MGNRTDRLARLARTTSERRRDRVEAERREAVDLLAQIEEEHATAIEVVTQLRGLRSQAGKVRGGIDGVPGDPPGEIGDLHRQVREAVRFSAASDNGTMGSTPDYPGDDAGEHGALWLARLRSRLAKVDATADLFASYTAAMRAGLEAQAGALADRYGSALPTAEARVARLEAEAVKARDAIAVCESELDELADAA